MFRSLQRLTSHWFGLVMLLHISLFIFQFTFLWPLEAIVFGPIAKYASILFIPHAVRVLSSWLLGPRALAALLPAELLVHYFYAPVPGFSLSHWLIPVLSASSAVFAFEFLKAINIDVYPRKSNFRSWRWVLLAGLIASAFNTISGTYLKVGGDSIGVISEVFTRFLIGDMAGLMVSLSGLLMIFMYADRIGR